MPQTPTEKELIKKYPEKKLPEFYKRLPTEAISPDPCFNCLKETEITVQKGGWQELPEPLKYWYEMADAESRELKKFLEEKKPKRVLEVGFGGGRIINTLLSARHPKKVFAVEKNKKMFETIKPFFESRKEVHLFNEDALDFIKKSEEFDLTVCMMNTLSQISGETFKEIAKKSKHFIFTVYDKSAYKLRAKIYKSKGHKNFELKDCTYCFQDPWVKGLESKSYSLKELEDICKITGKHYSIKKISKLLFLVHLSKE